MLIWMDLEMTGLNVETDQILEVATLITDDKLTIVAEADPLVLACPEPGLEAMIPIIREMHDKSGLTAEVRRSSLSVEHAEQQTLAFIQEHVPNPCVSPLCGNSVGYDRRFIAKYMPAVDKHLHYRCIDVTTITCLASLWAKPIFDAEPSRTERHRALDDIRESVAQLRYYSQYMFLPGGGAVAEFRAMNR
jgi:oligoribonuclease